MTEPVIEPAVPEAQAESTSPAAEPIMTPGEMADEAKRLHAPAVEGEDLSELSVSQLIENSDPSDSEAKVELRQVLRNYIKQNPVKAELEKEELLKQLNSK